jgi:hypothetical protein
VSPHGQGWGRWGGRQGRKLTERVNGALCALRSKRLRWSLRDNRVTIVVVPNAAKAAEMLRASTDGTLRAVVSNLVAGTCVGRSRCGARWTCVNVLHLFCICIRQSFQVIVEVHPADAESTLMSIRAVREAGPAGAPGALRIDFICDPML